MDLEAVTHRIRIHQTEKVADCGLMRRSRLFRQYFAISFVALCSQPSVTRSHAIAVIEAGQLKMLETVG